MGSAKELIRQVRTAYGVNEQVAAYMVEEAAKTAAAQKAQKEKIAKARALSYHQWLKTETSDPALRWNFRWQQYIIPYVQLVIDGEIAQLIINLPPRLGKSELVTKRLPVFWMERNPRDGIIVAAYNSDLAENFTSGSLKIYKERNPESVESEAKSEWSNVYGGFVRPVGVGSGVTGRGCELLILDDPVKNIKEALSRTYQESVWNWWLYDLRTRRNFLSRTPTIIIMTRWANEDLTGKLEGSSDYGDWMHITIPALSMTQEERDVNAMRSGKTLGEPDPMGREPGESIEEDRLPAYELQKLAKDPFSFSSLYQQIPIQAKLASFKTENLKYVDGVPRRAHRIRYWDSAASEGKGDWTVGVLMAKDEEGNICIEDVVRGQWSEDEVEKRMRETALADHAMYGGDPDWVMRQVYEQEPADSGKKVAIRLGKTVFAGVDAQPDRAQTNKIARIRPFSAAVNRGEVSLKKGREWIRDYVNEMITYVIGLNLGNDDQMDASAGAYGKLTTEFTIMTVS